MKNDVKAIANYVIKYVYQKEEKLFNSKDLNSKDFDLIDFKHLKLQKILYFLYGFYYSNTKKELFIPKFSAYKYGPVVGDIFKTVKSINLDKSANLPINLFEDFKDLDSEIDFNLVNQILDKLLKLSSWTLVEISHVEGSPWRKTDQSRIINKNLIHNYFIERDLK